MMTADPKVWHWPNDNESAQVLFSFPFSLCGLNGFLLGVLPGFSGWRGTCWNIWKLISGIERFCWFLSMNCVLYLSIDIWDGFRLGFVPSVHEHPRQGFNKKLPWRLNKNKLRKQHVFSPLVFDKFVHQPKTNNREQMKRFLSQVMYSHFHVALSHVVVWPAGCPDLLGCSRVAKNKMVRDQRRPKIWSLWKPWAISLSPSTWVLKKTSELLEKRWMILDVPWSRNLDGWPLQRIYTWTKGLVMNQASCKAGFKWGICFC